MQKKPLKIHTISTVTQGIFIDRNAQLEGQCNTRMRIYIAGDEALARQELKLIEYVYDMEIALERIGAEGAAKGEKTSAGIAQEVLRKIYPT